MFLPMNPPIKIGNIFIFIPAYVQCEILFEIFRLENSIDKMHDHHSSHNFCDFSDQGFVGFVFSHHWFYCFKHLRESASVRTKINSILYILMRLKSSGIY